MRRPNSPPKRDASQRKSPKRKVGVFGALDPWGSWGAMLRRPAAGKMAMSSKKPPIARPVQGARLKLGQTPRTTKPFTRGQGDKVHRKVA